MNAYWKSLTLSGIGVVVEADESMLNHDYSNLRNSHVDAKLFNADKHKS